MTFTSEIAALEYTSDALMNQLNYEWDVLMMEHSENIQAIEYKVLCENGTDDDLNALYIAEAEETAQRGKEKIGGIIGLIRRIFKKLKEILLGKDTDELKNINPNEKITLIADPEKLDNETKGILAKVKEWISGKKLGERFVDANLDTILAAPTVIAGGAIYNHFKKLGDTAGSVEQTATDCQKYIDSHPNMSVEELGRGKKLLGMLSKAGRGITNLVADGKDKIAEKINTYRAQHGGPDGEYNYSNTSKWESQYKLKKQQVDFLKKTLDEYKGSQNDPQYQSMLSKYNKLFDECQELKKKADASFANDKKNDSMDNSEKLEYLKGEIKKLEDKTKSKQGMNALTDSEKAQLETLRKRRNKVEAHLKKFAGKAKQNRKNIYTRHNPDADTK